ncbi:mitochondrial carrier protein, putative [Ichthyophthirius multifiliis]|uniref:Mitochondrial carrier protein, putative n=1 Tax=Ichthyophthirius multifiliis TaxID=5932 RepID=G0R0K8_ICHMU|nr:mitochondrial carrier protein, putative [Ichthyophthirius multifiliis]EGR28994.1 mitochondrial carrier protein, putative [Ichthyophthirius multifiliis]|eukprot:XP_004030230.1 mitochondrial carrier protein, putative [Ichthyophthirius multifiliis]
MFVYPLDTVKRRMQMDGYIQNYTFKNTKACIQYMYQNEGVSSFYGGFTVSCVKFVLSSITQTILADQWANQLYIFKIIIGLPGIEPGSLVPETSILPLNHKPFVKFDICNS